MIKPPHHSLLIISFILLVLSLYSQKYVTRIGGRFINQRSSGVMLQYGLNFYDLPESYGYRPVLLTHVRHYPLFKTRHNINLAIDIGPQAGIVKTDKLNFEVGLFVCLNLGFAFTDWDMLSLIAGTGPHYTIVATERQASGFIFSNNLLLAYRRKVLIDRSPFGISLYGGFRHLSNAGLKQPNRGIDNIMTGIGFCKLF